MSTRFALISPIAIFVAGSIAGFVTVGTAGAGITPQVSYHFDPPSFRGDSSQLVVHVVLPPDWHIQSFAPLDSFLIPTVLHAEGQGLVFGQPVYPKPEFEEIPALGGKVALFQGAFDIRTPVKAKGGKPSAAALKTVKVSLRYQACNNTQCLPPREVAAQPAGP